MAITHNFSIEQGSDFNITFIYQDVAGNRIDLSNGAIVFRFKPTNSTTIYQFTRADVDNNYISSGDIGEINIYFPADETQDFDFVNAAYDLDFQPNVTSGQKQTNTKISTGIITLIKKNFNTFVGADTGSGSTGGGGPSSIPMYSRDGDQCADALSCVALDTSSIVYSSGHLTIYDNQNNSGTIYIDDTRTIDKIEIIINNLKHDSPQDLTLLLDTPTTDMILLSSNNKISKYDPDVYTNGFSFIFSNRAPVNTFLNTVENNGFCRIDDKTDIVQFNGNTLSSNLNDIRGEVASGNYTLYINDNDILGSGSISSWDLIITYII